MIDLEGSAGASVIWVMVCSVLIALMQAGFLCLETGLCRSKNSINIAIKNFSDLAISVVTFSLFGASLMYGPTVGGIFGFGEMDGASGSLPIPVFLTFQLLFCATAATIMSGASVERMRFCAYLAAATIMIVLIYPVFGHWVWAEEGWLNRLGARDFAGATVVHSIGGWAALALAIALGPRLGRFSATFGQRAQSLPLAALGCLLLWVGWLGFNGGSTLELNATVPSVLQNTLLGGAAAVVIVLAFLLSVPGRSADPVQILNGGIAGLVAVTASADVVSTWVAVLIGGTAGLCCLGASRLLERLEIDDGIGVTAAHLAPGILGSLAVPFVATPEMISAAGGFAGLLAAQATMVVAAGIWAFAVMFGSIKLIGVFWPIRVSKEDELRGLDQVEHGMVSELAMARRELKAQLHRTLVQDGPELDPNSECGSVVQVVSEAVSQFHVKQDQWLARIAQLETANGLLKTRTTDLESALVDAGGALRTSMNRFKNSAAAFQDQIEAVECREDGRKKVLDYVALTASACARLISNMAEEAHSAVTVDVSKGSLQRVTRISQLLASDLDDLVQLCILADDDDPLTMKACAVNDTIVATLREVSKGRKKRTMDLITVDAGDDLPNLVTNQGAFGEVFRGLLEEALTRCSSKKIRIGVSSDPEGLHLVVNDAGPALDEREIAILLDPIESMANGRMPRGRISCRLGLANLLARRLGAEFSVNSSVSGGLAYSLDFPNKLLVKAQGSATPPPRAAAAAAG